MIVFKRTRLWLSGTKRHSVGYVWSTDDNSGMQGGFIFWSTAPFLVAFIVLMPFLIPLETTSAMLAIAGLEVAATMLLLGLYDAERFNWALRTLGAMVFLACAAYLIAIIVQGQWRVGRKAELTVFNASCTFFLFGVPGLLYAIRGRLSAASDSFSEEQFDEDADEEDGTDPVDDPIAR